MNTSKTWSRTPAPVRNLHDLLNSSRVSSFFRRVLDGFKHGGFLWNLKLKPILIKWTHKKCGQEPQPQSGTSKIITYKANLQHSSACWIFFCQIWVKIGPQEHLISLEWICKNNFFHELRPRLRGLICFQVPQNWEWALFWKPFRDLLRLQVYYLKAEI